MRSEVNVATWFGQNLYRLDLPYYSCFKCRIIYYDKKETERRVKKWLQGANSFSGEYEKIIFILDEIVKEYTKYRGYRFQQFTKKK